jgi:hypothetical protein
LVLIRLVISQNHSRNCLGYCLHNINKGVNAKKI